MRSLLLTLLLLVAAPAFPAVTAMTWELGGLYQATCELQEVDCTDISSPLLIVADFGHKIDALGMYPTGTNVVMLTAECDSRMADKVKCDAVLVHEISHYLSFLGNPTITSCETEAVAWDVHNAYVMQIKRYDLVRENWRKDYPLCVKSPNDSTSSDTQ